MLNTDINQLIPPTCFVVGCTIFKETIPLFVQELCALCNLADLQNQLHTVSNNSVHGWCKSFINTSTYV